MGGLKNHRRKCIICGEIELIRKDNKALKCGACSRKQKLVKANEILNQLTLERKHKCPVCNNLVDKRYVCCSIECKKKYTKKIELVCETCLKPFVLLKSLLPPYNKKTNARGRFCSKNCYSEWQRK